MNALTKVLVVLVLLLSVGFAVSQMVLFSKRENFGLEYQKAAKLLKETKAQREQLAGELEGDELISEDPEKRTTGTNH